MYKDFRLGADYNSLFWQYAHRFNIDLNGIDDLNFVWMNVNKFGSGSGVGKPELVEFRQCRHVEQQAVHAQAVLDDEVKYYNLLVEELAILKLDVCLFLTGPNYDQDIARKLPDVEFHSLCEFGEREAARLHSRYLPRHSYRTYHPGYGNRISETYQRILNAILDECKR